MWGVIVKPFRVSSFSGDFYDTLGTLPLANPYGHCVSEGRDIAFVLWYNGWLAFVFLTAEIAWQASRNML